MRKIIFLVLLVIALLISFQVKSWVDTTVARNTGRNSDATNTPVVVEPISTTTTVLGSFTCLPHKGNPEVITLECAFGLKATDGKHYALDWSDNATSAFDLPMDRQYSVTGHFTPIEMISSEQWSRYDVVGIIKVSSYTEIVKDIPVYSVGSTFDAQLNKSFIVNDTKFVVTAVLEDSRCPADVTCIQAGRVKIALSITSPSGPSSTEMQIGETITTETLALTLDSVTPYPVSTKKTEDGQYLFTFTAKVK